MSAYHDDETFWMFEYRELKTDYEQLKEENERLKEKLKTYKDSVAVIKFHINAMYNI